MENNNGAQIDLLFDRRDNAITLCEIKYSKQPFVLTKKFVADLLQKERVLKKQTRTTKQVFWSLISANGLQDNFYSTNLNTRLITF